MYCYSRAASGGGVLKELITWSKISREHPIFIKALADLAKTPLKKEEEESLREVNAHFACLHKKAKRCQRELTSFPLVSYPHIQRYVVPLLRGFLRANSEAIRLYDSLRCAYPSDKTLKTLVDHVMEEQHYVHRLFGGYLEQLR